MCKPAVLYTTFSAALLQLCLYDVNSFEGMKAGGVGGLRCHIWFGPPPPPEHKEIISWDCDQTDVHPAPPPPPQNQENLS